MWESPGLPENYRGAPGGSVLVFWVQDASLSKSQKNSSTGFGFEDRSPCASHGKLFFAKDFQSVISSVRQSTQAKDVIFALQSWLQRNESCSG